jgi:ABC-type glycerol-3-phosphate transport system substrate-binding protein
VRNYLVLAALAMLGACGGNDGSPNATASADKQATAIDATAATAASPPAGA